MKKKLCNKPVWLLVILLCFAVGAPLQAQVDYAKLLRKGVGLIGIGLMVNGAWKIIKRRPVTGLLRIVAGAAIAAGGMCSDIIYARVESSLHRAHTLQQGPDSQKLLFGDNFRKLCQEVGYQAGIAYNGGAIACAHALKADWLLKDGWRTLKGGNVIGGICKTYDALYSYVRARCLLALYPL
jgi:hypothetical protein